MPSQNDARRERRAARQAAPKFDFKKLKRDTGSGAGSSSSSGGSGSYSGEAKPTTTRVHECVHQSGEHEGEKSDNHLFVFNPRFGQNDAQKAEVMKHAKGKNQVSSFNKELNGFHIKVHAPKQAQNMHAAPRGLDPELPAELDVGDWEHPEVEVVTFTNLDLPATKAAAAQEGITALMLDGYTYPLYRDLRKLKYDFVRGVHGMNGINRWVRIVGAKEKAAQLEKEVTAFLLEEGWQVTTAAADAADWEDDE